MKKYLTFFIMMILFAGLSEAYYNMDVTLLNQDPDPVRPSQYVELRFQVENKGSDALNGVKVEILPEYPFYSDTDTTIDVGQIGAYQDADDIAVVKFKLRVDKDAVEGTNDLKIRYYSDELGWMTSEDDFEINIRTVDATIAVNSVRSIPEKIIPGEGATVKITLENAADSTVRDISIILDLSLVSIRQSLTSATAALTTSLFEEIPFAPLHSSTEKRIKNLDPGEKIVVSYDLISYPDAEAKVYKVPILISFYNELNELQVKSDIIGLVVGTEPDLSVILDSSTFIKSGTAGDIGIKFVNKGLSEIKFLNVELGSSEKYDILSSEEVYIGNIESDDYETADFELFLKDTLDEEIKLPISMQYRDSNNEYYEKEVEVSLKLFNEEERETLMLEKKDNTWYIVIGVVAVVVLFFIIRRWRKKKAKK